MGETTSSILYYAYNAFSQQKYREVEKFLRQYRHMRQQGMPPPISGDRRAKNLEDMLKYSIK